MLKTIYFLINNQYQLIDTKKHLTHFNKKKYKVIILICSRINLIKDLKGIKGFKVINLYPQQIRFRFTWFLNFIKLSKFFDKIENLLTVNKNTYLFFYNEVSIHNHLIVKHIKKNGGKSYIINDAGFATYISFSNFTETIYSKSMMIKKYMLKLIPSLKDIRLVKGLNYYYFWLPDDYIDGVIGYRYFTHKRNFPTYLVHENKKFLRTFNSNKVLYLNSPFYLLDLDLNLYLKIHHKVISKLLKSYSEVIFKFHPRDTKLFRNEIKKRYYNNKKIKVLDSTDDYQNLIHKLNIKCVASIYSGGCLSVPEGIKVIFCFNLVKNFFPLGLQNQFKKTETLLMLWGGKKEKEGIILPSTFKNQKKYNFLNNLLSLVELKKNK